MRRLATSPQVAAPGRRKVAELRLRLSLDLIAHEIRKAYAGTVLGRAWLFLQPVLFLGVYIFLFGVLRVPKQIEGGPAAQIAVVFSGLVPWLYFARSVPSGLNSLLSHSALIRQINFPVGILPLVVVGTEVAPFLVGLAGLTVLVATQGWLSWTILLLFPAAFLMTLFLIGVTAFVAPIGVMLRDVRVVLPVVLRLTIFLTPVLWLPSRLPKGFTFLAYINPLTYFIDIFRFAAFNKDKVRFISLQGDFAVVTGVTLLALLAGYAMRGYVRRVAVDHL